MKGNGFRDYYKSVEQSLIDGTITPELRMRLLSMLSQKMIRDAEMIYAIQERMDQLEDHMTGIQQGLEQLLKRTAQPHQGVIKEIKAQNERLDKLIAGNANGNGAPSESFYRSLIEGRKEMTIERWKIIGGIITSAFSGGALFKIAESLFM